MNDNGGIKLQKIKIVRFTIALQNCKINDLTETEMNFIANITAPSLLFLNLFITFHSKTNLRKEKMSKCISKVINFVKLIHPNKTATLLILDIKL